MDMVFLTRPFFLKRYELVSDPTRARSLFFSSADSVSLELEREARSMGEASFFPELRLSSSR